MAPGGLYSSGSIFFASGRGIVFGSCLFLITKVFLGVLVAPGGVNSSGSNCFLPPGVRVYSSGSIFFSPPAGEGPIFFASGGGIGLGSCL